MTITLHQLAFYAGALFILFMTPGPVWVALIARAMSGGFASAWPLALGVVVGDVIWPLVAVLGVGLLVSAYSDVMTVLGWVAAAIFVMMGAALIRHRDRLISSDSRLTAPGAWAGFSAGLLVIMSNPKAILFYMGVLPGFFDLAALTAWDLVAICTLSALVPLLGNLALGFFVHRARALVRSPGAMSRMNLVAGILLILVGVVIAIGTV